jgi:5-hydroxyisourate hydrolase/2-oxo-4-hydroxy-4-carboxy-5-ureidoimidazoline decarboxylase
LSPEHAPHCWLALTRAQDLSAWNARYEARFGHIFILCATGVSAAEVLRALRSRFTAAPHAELASAAGEQAKITALRLDKLLSSLAAGAPPATAERRAGAIEAHIAPQPQPQPQPASSRRAPITTHVLDTSRGAPAASVPALLEMLAPGSGGASPVATSVPASDAATAASSPGAAATWFTLGRGVTDADGRIATLLPGGYPLAAGTYRLTFDTDAYLSATGASGAAFFPAVSLVFRVGPHQTGQHFHVPLLLAPFGFSTYRGS